MNAPYHNKALHEGTVLREWRLEEVLGAGGFGIVYRGKGIHFGETVAIKEYFPGAISDRIDGTTVAPTDSSSEEIYQLGRQKFMEEAKILWNLSHPERHPNLVAVRSLFEIHGTAYMVMDFESGISLSQMLKEGKRFDEKGLMALIRPVAEGLERAHRAGVLHRDIKPANILVNGEGRPVLIDFGSARFESSQATNTKVTFYTPPYAAIEQYVKSYPQGPWTDIYALGVVLYQCVTGEKPPEVLERMHGEDGRLLSAREWPGFGRAFTRAVDAAMALRPLERPADISSWLKMFDAADPVLSDETTRIAVMPRSASPASARAAGHMPEPPAGAEQVAVSSVMTAQQPKISPASHPAPAAKRSGKLTIIALSSTALFVVLAAAGLFVSRWHKTADTMPAGPATQAQSANAPAQTTNIAAALPTRMDALIDAAKKARRDEREISALSDAKARLATLVAAKADPAQLSATAGDMAKAENDALARGERRMWREVATPPDAKDAADGADALARLNQAKTDLDLKLAAESQDPGQIIDQTRLALASFAAFQDAYGAANPVYVTARRKAFARVQAAAQALCAQVISLANVEKPWFLASSARKAAYKLRQDNAAQAKTLSARLDDLARMAATSSDLHQLTAGLSEAAAAQKTASDLYASSNSAAL